MKMVIMILAILGAVGTVVAVIGRFYGAPSIIGFSAQGMLATSNAFLLLSLVASTMLKK